MFNTGAVISAALAGSVISVWSTTMFTAATLRASSTPFTSEINPRGASKTE